MTGLTNAANAEERIVRIEKMVADLAGVEQRARRLAADVREKAKKIAVEAELEALEQAAQQIAADVADKAAKIAAELTALKRLRPSS